MPFNDDEQSKHAGRPVELFKYEGTYADYFYTSGPAEVTYLGDLYVPIATKRSVLNVQTQNDDNSEVTIELPVSSQLVAVYGFQIAPPDLKLTIYRGHNGDYVRAWSGNVENIQVVKGTASVRVPSDLAAALNADFPNVYYQGPCNHALFDARCGVSYAAWSFATTVTAINAANPTLLTLAGIGTLDGQLVGGDAVLASGERRMIVAQAGNIITVNYPFAQVAITNALTIAAACDLAWAGDCATRFNNQERFGGMPFIPPKNIFAKGLEPGKNVTDEPCLPYLPEYPGWDYELRWVVSQSGGDPTLLFREVNFPGTGGVYNQNTSTNPAGPVFSKGTRFDAGSNTRTYYLRMKRDFPVGTYEVIFDPPNLPGFQNYRFQYLGWSEIVPTDLIVPFGSSSGGTLTRNFTVT